MSRKNKTVILLLLCIFLIVLFTSLATYAYFNAREIFYGSFDVEINSKGVDTLYFSGSKNATIVANAANFSMGIGHNVKGTAEVDVTLETTKKNAEYCYEMYFNLPNEIIFEYSNGSTPELLLSIRKSSDGVNFQNVIIDMDITQKVGTIKIPNSQNGDYYLNKISTVKNKLAKDIWQAEVTLVWFKNVDQTINDNKSYSATLEAKRVECN